MTARIASHGGTACETINGAVNYASSGDTIHIAAGAYTETVSISNIDLTFIGAGENSTFVDGGGANSVFYIASQDTANISDMTIRNGKSSFGGGIYVSSRATLTLTNSTVFSNTGTSGVGGIFNFGGSATISNTTIISNTAGSGDGGGIYNHSVSTMTIHSSTISTNTAGLFGGGIFNGSDGTLIIHNSTINGNQTQGDLEIPPEAEFSTTAAPASAALP